MQFHKRLAEIVVEGCQKHDHRDGYAIDLHNYMWEIQEFMTDEEYKEFNKLVWVGLDGEEEWKRQWGEGA